MIDRMYDANRVLNTIDDEELSELQEAVLSQNEKNQSLLKEHMTQLRNQITKIGDPRFNPYAKKTSIYSQKTSIPSIIDVEV